MSRDSRSALTRVASVAVVMTTVAAISGCSFPQDGRSTPGSASSPSSPASSPSLPGGRLAAPSAPGGTSTGAQSPEAGPALPLTPGDEAVALAAQVTRAERTIRDPDASPDQVRRAGEFVQLAVRELATAPRQFRRDVVSRLDGAVARATRENLAAALSLEALVVPQPRFPEWRIVRPPPPESLREHYRRAERRTGVPWSYLAAIHLVETRMGRIRGTSSAGAQGPMQFIPSTWDIYGDGGDIHDPADAIQAAGRLLADHGAPRDMGEALWHYNPSRSYVRSVSAYARVMERSPRAYPGYWSWRVFFAHRDGTFVLPEGYPDERPVPLDSEP